MTHRLAIFTRFSRRSLCTFCTLKKRYHANLKQGNTRLLLLYPVADLGEGTAPSAPSPHSYWGKYLRPKRSEKFWGPHLIKRWYQCHWYHTLFLQELLSVSAVIKATTSKALFLRDVMLTYHSTLQSDYFNNSLLLICTLRWRDAFPRTQHDDNGKVLKSWTVWCFSPTQPPKLSMTTVVKHQGQFSDKLIHDKAEAWARINQIFFCV